MAEKSDQNKLHRKIAVVGKFSSATALGSVGSTSTLVTLFTGFLIGKR